MLKDFAVSRFRSLKGCRLDPLGGFTLIAGKNGAGKTALLEALWLFTGSDDPELGTRMNALRGGFPVNWPAAFQALFHNLDARRPIKMKAHGFQDGQARELDIALRDRQGISKTDRQTMGELPLEHPVTSPIESEKELVFQYRDAKGHPCASRTWWSLDPLNPDGLGTRALLQERQTIPGKTAAALIPAILQHTPQGLASLFGTAQLAGKEDEVLAFLEPLEPRLVRLSPLPLGDQTTIYAYLDGHSAPVPAQLLGEGFNRMLALALSINAAQGGMLLIDEIENSLHHSIYGQAFTAIRNMAEACNVQICATTYSYECVVAAYETFGGVAAQDFAFYRLDRKGNATHPVQYDNQMMATAIEHHMEFR